MSDIDMDVDPKDNVKSFDPVPEGEYLLSISNVTPGTTKTGRKKLDLELTIDEGEFLGRKLWNTLVFIPKGENGHGLMVQTLKAFGLMSGEDNKVSLSYEDFKNRTARARVIIDVYEGKKSNKVKTGGWITNEEPAPANTPAKAKQPAAAGRKLF